MFYISNVGLSGKLGDSDLALNRGLNVVYGSSNTGKSIIVECIDYALGDKECAIELDGYDSVYVTLCHPKGSVRIKRKLGEGNVTIESDNPSVPSGVYPIRKKGKKHESDPCLADFILRLADMPEREKVVVSQSWAKKEFTFRVCLNSFIVKQENIIRRESPLLPLENMAKSIYKSGLLFLWTGETFRNDDNKDDLNARRLKKSAVENFITEQLNKINRDFPELDGKAKVDPDEVEKRIDEIMKEIDANREILNSLFDENRKLSGRIMELDDGIAEGESLLVKYEALNTQYIADKKRLDFVVEGESHPVESTDDMRCPFCNGKLDRGVKESCAEAAEKELLRLVPKIRDLSETMADTRANIEKLRAERQKVSAAKDDVQQKISGEIKPLIANLQGEIKAYRTSIEDAKEAKILLAQRDSYAKKISEMEKEIVKATDEKFDVMSYYDPIIEELTNEYDSLLRQANYHFKDRPVFQNFDFVIDGKHKYAQGQGYRAYLNGLLCLALYEALWKHGTFPMPFLVMDSPIQSLVEKEGIPAEGSMRVGFFKCLKQIAPSQQVIVIENHLPKGLDFSDVNLVSFTKDDATGRYGFARDVRD